MSNRRLSDSEIETLINLWHTKAALWDCSQLIYINTDVRKAALSRISKEMKDKYVIMLDFVCFILRFMQYYVCHAVVWHSALCP